MQETTSFRSSSVSYHKTSNLERIHLPRSQNTTSMSDLNCLLKRALTFILSLRSKMSSSRHSSSRHHRSHQSRSTETSNAESEAIIEQIKGVLTILYEVALTRPHEWETYLPSARSAMTALDHIRFFRDPTRFAEQIWIIQGLQDYAYHDADSGCIRDIAEYCQASWLRVLRNYPENVDTLTGKLSSPS